MDISLIAQTDCENVQTFIKDVPRVVTIRERKREEVGERQENESFGNGRLLPTNSGL